MPAAGSTRSSSIKRITPELAAAVVQIRGTRRRSAARSAMTSGSHAARMRLGEAGIGDDALRPLRGVVPAATFDASRVFGEPLPHGLRLG